VICVAPSHPLLSHEIEEVQFQSDLLNLQVHGKRKSKSFGDGYTWS